MSRRSTKLFKAALTALHYTGAGQALAPWTRGVGTIFMLHQVGDASDGECDPNRILRITPEFLEKTIAEVRKSGFDLVSLDEVHRRLAERDFSRRFAAFTLDDGYRDNLENAYPIFRRNNVPFAIYVPTAYADGKGHLWWLSLERAICILPRVEIRMNGELQSFKCETIAQKESTYHRLYWWLRGIDEREARGIIHQLAASCGIDEDKMCRDLIMNWDEIRKLAADPLVTIGAHTRGHFAVAKLSDAEARAEMASSIQRLEQELGRPCKHFSYPFGDATSAGRRDFRIASELGLKTAVTTRKGLLYTESRDGMMELPRLSLNGDYQDVRYLQVLMSGLPFACYQIANRIRTRPEPA